MHGSCAADKRTAEQNLEMWPPVFLPNSLSSLTFAPFFFQMTNSDLGFTRSFKNGCKRYKMRDKKRVMCMCVWGWGWGGGVGGKTWVHINEFTAEAEQNGSEE